MADKSTYKIAFKLENFIAQQADQEEEPEPEPDPDEPGTVFIDLFNSEDPVPNTSYWQLCTYANNAWAQHFQHVDGYETVKVEDGYLKLTVKKRVRSIKMLVFVRNVVIQKYSPGGES